MHSLRRSIKVLLTVALVVAVCESLPAAAQSCRSSGVAVQVLGSGGPETQDKRASTSYLIWKDGKARVILDAGGGSALRFGESGAQMSTLDVFLFSHFHVDHSSDFPALIFSSWHPKSNELSRDTFFAVFYLGWNTGIHEMTTFISCFRAKVNNPISTSKYICVVFNN